MDTTGTMQKYSGITVFQKVVLLESARSIFYSPYSVNVTVTNELLDVYKTLISAKTLCFMTFSLFCHCYQYKKGDMLYILKMWIPRYIDMNPHFSQNILNKGIFQMLIHHYIDMNPHMSKHIKIVYLKNVDTSL